MQYKVVAIGLDGASFDVIAPLVKRRKLPNLAKIMESGVYGNLRSTIHPITSHAWTSFLTGKNAGKHGIFDFTRRKEGSYETQFTNSSMRKAESIFSLLSKAEKKAGAIAIPFTYPPEKINGFMLSGLDAPDGNEEAVYPVSLYREIKDKFDNYHIHLASPVGRIDDDDKYWKDICAEDENRTRISKYLLQKYPCDFFMTVYNNTDRAQHQYFDRFLYETLQTNDTLPMDNMLVKTYINTDAHVGSLLSDIDEDTVVIVMSDHGAGPIRKVFYLNRWLEKNGLLRYKKSSTSYFRGAVQQARFFAKRFLPRKTKNLLKRKMGIVRDKIDSMLWFSDINWEATKAYGFGMYGNVYINLRGREPNGIVEPGDEYTDICNQIIQSLQKITDPESGEKIIDKVYKREELFQGPYLEQAPDLLIGWKDYAYYTSVRFGKESGNVFGSYQKIDSSEYAHVGTHRINGVFMAMGNIIKKGETVKDASIVDIAPTILYMLGLPIPDDMDGKPLLNIFQEEFLMRNPPPV